MRIESLNIKNFRSLAKVSIEKCSSLNILIGKNNSGKSNLLAAIDIALSHLKRGRVASNWPRGRYKDEFYNRNTARRIQIGIQLSISEDENEQIRQLIADGVEGIDVALRNVKESGHLSIIISGRLEKDILSRYVERISFGTLLQDGEDLSSDGNVIFYVPDDLASELIEADRRLARLRSSDDAIEKAAAEIRTSPVFRRERERDEARYYIRRASSELSASDAKRMEEIVTSSADVESFNAGIQRFLSEIAAAIDELRRGGTSQVMQAFSGSVRRVPDYVINIMSFVAGTTFLHFREAREPIGRQEADQLLSMKTTRGGPQQLTALQATIKSLLDVSVDAFSGEAVDPRASRTQASQAEMDVDEFLAEANGAGIREALRIILDLELKKPQIALIEEPEVHLHPGLERIMHSYLVSKGSDMQIFVATHSTNFLDVSSRQNVYTVSRVSGSQSAVAKVLSETEFLRVPADIGLRPSTIFMFDRLLFVEGPSDEAILRELAIKLGIDLSLNSVGVVQMGGASSLGIFAADRTLDLLCRRQVPMFFLADRDERKETEIARIQSRVGDRARVHWLTRRELENYLLVPSAIQALVERKWRNSARRVEELPSHEHISEALHSAARGRLASVSKRMIARNVLSPIYVDRIAAESPREKITAAINILSSRLDTIDDDIAAIENGIKSTWENEAINKASGSEILGDMLGSLGLSYKKDRDAVRLAQKMDRTQIHSEISEFLRSLVR